MVDGPRICDPYAILLHARTNDFNQVSGHKTLACFRWQARRTPKGPFQRTTFPNSSRNLFSAPPASWVMRYHWCPLRVSHSAPSDYKRSGWGAGLTPWGHTKNPRWVRRAWYIPHRGKPPAPSKNGVREGCRTDRGCSELILHGGAVV